ncbi:MAG: hypothetical protein Q9160_001733 [Pyrenula sp. 1 TL-2023]
MVSYNESEAIWAEGEDLSLEEMDELMRRYFQDSLEQAPGGNEESAAGPLDVVEGEGTKKFDDVEQSLGVFGDEANVDKVGKLSISHQMESELFSGPNGAFMDTLTATSFGTHIDNVGELSNPIEIIPLAPQKANEGFWTTAIGVPAGRANSETPGPPSLFPITVDGEQFRLDRNRYTFNREDNTIRKTERERRERRAVRQFNRERKARFRAATPSTTTSQRFSSLGRPPGLPCSPPRPEQLPLPPLPLPPPSYLPAPQAPSSQPPPTKSLPREKGKRLWTEEEDDCAIKHMCDVLAEDVIHFEARFEEAARRMRGDGFIRGKIAFKNRWNWELRDKCGHDERGKKTPNLKSSQQGKKKKSPKQAKPATPPTLAAAGAIEPAGVPAVSIAEPTSNAFDEYFDKYFDGDQYYGAK